MSLVRWVDYKGLTIFVAWIYIISSNMLAEFIWKKKILIGLPLLHMWKGRMFKYLPNRRSRRWSKAYTGVSCESFTDSGCSRASRTHIYQDYDSQKLICDHKLQILSSSFQRFTEEFKIPGVLHPNSLNFGTL